MVANISILDTTPKNASIQLDIDDVMSSVRRSISWANRVAPGGARSTNRYDSAGQLVMPSRNALDAYNRQVDQQAISEYLSDHGQLPSGLQAHWREHLDGLPQDRRDALGAGLGGGAGGFPRDFEYIRTQLWEEKRQPLNALRLFPRDTSVPLGARTHTARRMKGNGEAEIYRGGSVQVRARTTYGEETFGVVYIVSAVQTQFFEQLTTDYAGIRQYQNDMRVARRVVDEKVNEIFFNGDEPSDVCGVLNYPDLATQPFGLTISDSTDPKAIVRQLHNVQYTPMIRTGGTFSPTRMVTSPRIRAFLASRKHELNGGTDTTMLEYFLSKQDESFGVSSVDVAQELQGIGPNGEDGMLFYLPQLDSMGLVDIQSTTTLPVFQSSALEQVTVVYSAIGGVVMGDLGNHILALAPTDGIG